MRQSSDRVPNSFGVAGHLGSDAEVFYQSVFTPKSAGRIADLLAAKLRPTGVHEFALRSVIEIVLFEAYWGQVEIPTTETLVHEPLVLECGFDSHWIAVGASFSIKNDILSGKLATLCELLRSVADRVIFKKDQTGRIEFIAMLGFPSESPEFMKDSPAEIEMLDLGSHLEESPPVARYLELGDLDYHKLLGEELALRSKETEGEALSRASWKDAEDGSLSHIKGLPKINEEYSVVRGDASGAMPSDMYGVVESSADPRLTGKVNDLRMRAQTRVLREELDQFGTALIPSPQEKESTGILGFFKKLVKSKAAETPKIKTPQIEVRANEPIPEPASTVESEMIASQGELAPLVESAITSEAEKFNDTIERIKAESKVLTPELKTDRAKRWMDGMVSELVAEKARIQEMLKRVGLLSRQKELEFKNKERVYEEEIRKRDEISRQRLGALNVSKDTIQALQAELQKSRIQARDQASESEIRRKLEYAQSVLDRLRQENEILKSKAREARPVGSQTKANAEATVIREKYEKSQRMLEDFRRQNAQLIARVGEMEKRSISTGGRIEELRVKVEQAAMVLNDRKKEIEGLRKALSDKEVSEIRLKRRAAELESQLVILKKTSGGDGKAA